VNDPREFGLVCPDRTLGSTGANVALGLFQVVNQTGTSPVKGSYKEGTTVTFGTQTAAGAQIPPTQDQENGVPTAEIVANHTLTVPTGWNTPRTPGRTWPGTIEDAAQGRITLVIGDDAVPNPLGDADPSNDQYLGTALWKATGTKHDNNVLSGPTVVGTEDRNQAIRWTVRDGDDEDCNRAPRVSASFASSTLACPGDASLTLTIGDPDLDVASANGENLDVDIDWGDHTSTALDDQTTSPGPVGHTYGAAGAYTAEVTVTDQHGETDHASASVTVDYGTGGILQPINASGTPSVFRAGSTVPVKIRFVDCDGSTPSDLAPTIAITRSNPNPPPAEINENPTSTSAADSGVRMRYSEGQWIYNLATSSLGDPSATYHLTITVPETGQTVTATFALRR
jgi:hypothetical protein